MLARGRLASLFFDWALNPQNEEPARIVLVLIALLIGTLIVVVLVGSVVRQSRQIKDAARGRMK